MPVPALPRWILRPGVRVLRRSPDALQVGLEPGRAAVVPDDPDTRALLAALADGAPLPAGTPPGRLVDRLVDRLRQRDLVVDRAALDRVLVADDAGRRRAAALFARAGAGGATAARDRARARVAVRPTGRGASGFGADLEALLQRAGLVAAAEPDVVVLLGDGEPPREVTDEPMRRTTAHLLLTLVEARWRVGPFVLPGRSACLRCIDAHLADRDPRWPLLVEQHQAAPEPRRLPSPADPALTAVALGLAAADVAAYVDGRVPLTWSATVTVGTDLDLAPRRWARHPRCGCCWDALEMTG